VVDWAAARGWSVREAAQGGCAALADARVMAQKTGELNGCRASTGLVLREIAADPKLKLIVLSLRWPLYNGDRPRYAGNTAQLTLLDARAPGHRVYPLDEALTRTLDAIEATGTKARVVVLGPVPELTFSPSYCVAMARHLGRAETPCWDAPAALPLARARPAEVRIANALATHPGVGVFYPARRLCTQTSCITELNRRLIYFDNDHLSASGSRTLVPGWLDAALSLSGSAAVPLPAGPPPPPR
jgi:hypothetical protein